MTTRTPEERAEFLKCMQLLWSAFASTSAPQIVPEDKVRVYNLALADMPIPYIKRATLKAIKTLKFFPKPSELREMGPGIAYRLDWQRKAKESARLAREDHLRLKRHRAVIRADGPKLLSNFVEAAE